MTDASINHVSDTAIWVAHYRAVESARPDALFKDPFAQKLVGERGAQIASHAETSAAYIEYNVALRTYIIDRQIKKLVAEGVDTVLNLGAGLDARPYRLDLPAIVTWIEADYPHLIQYKSEILKTETPRLKLEKVGIDLADRERRRQLLARVSAQAKKVLVLTEGVLSYLTEDHVSELAEDLHAQANFQFWIADYLSPDAHRFLTTRKRRNEMKHAPFVFFPKDWGRFFSDRKWKTNEVDFITEEAEKLGRPMPRPWWAHLVMPLMTPTMKMRVRRMSGYAIFERT